jgi:ankyrin repeat protein/tellurite resistance protein
MNEDELQTFIRAAFSASYMIAAADGEISSEEMQAFMDALKQHLDVDMDPDELFESFEAALELGTEQHLERIAEAAVLPVDLRRDILDIALSIAESDGDFDPSEIQCLPIVAAALDVDLSGDEEEESEDSDADPDDGGEDIDPVANLPSNAGIGLPDLDPDQSLTTAAALDGNLDTFIRAAFSASYMIAAADGEISSEEMQAFMDALKQRLDVDMDPAELLESFEAALELEAEQHLERIAEAAVLPADLRRDILDIALSIVASDGDVDPREIQCLPIVAAALDVDLSGDEEEESEDSDADPDDSDEDINPVASLPSNAGIGLPDLDPDQNPIIAATLDGNVDKLKRLLAQGHSATDIHDSGTDALILAVREGHLEIVDLLLGSGADPNRMNPKSGMTPIWMAVQELRPQIAGVLLERDADPDQPRQIPEANIDLVPLAGLQFLASKYDDARAFEMIDLFLRSGADPNRKGPSLCFPLLALAIRKHRPQTLDLLLGAGVDPNVTDEKTEFQVLPVLIGAATGEKDGKALHMLDSLLSAGLRKQNIQIEGDSIPAVQFCAMQDDLPPGFLSRIAAGATKADVDLALWAACIEGVGANVQDLLGVGADVNMTVPWLDHDPTAVGDSPLNAAATRGHTECARLLIDAGADVNRNSPPEGGQFPLLMAAENGHQEIVSMLLSAGADVSMINPENGTHPLLMAAQGGHHETVEELLRAGADPNLTSDISGNAPLHWAVQTGDASIVELLVAAGAQPELTHPRTGMTPLELAILINRNDLVEALGYR